MTTFDTRFGVNVLVRHDAREIFRLIITVTDQDDAAVDLSAKDLTFSVRETENGTAVEELTKADGITVSGASNNVVTITGTFTNLTDRSYYHDLENTTDSKTIIDGEFESSYTGR